MDSNTKKVLYGFGISLIIIAVILMSFDKIQSNEKEMVIEEGVIVTEVKPQPKKLNVTVSMIMGLNQKVDKNVAKVISVSVEKYSKKYSLSIPLILALMNRESGFRPIVTSKANCIGLMQINPKSHPEKVKPYKYDELYHIDPNVKIGCMILREYLDKKKTIKGALESYLGASNNGYLMDILSTTVELGIKN